MAVNAQKNEDSLKVINGDKSNYELELVGKIIKGELTGQEFCDKVAPKGKPKAVSAGDTLQEQHSEL